MTRTKKTPKQIAAQIYDEYWSAVSRGPVTKHDELPDMRPLLEKAIIAAVEEEREACAAIAKAVKERWEKASESGIGFNKNRRHSRSLTAEEIEFRIRGRNPEWSAS
jgi:hypothetical protein